VGADLGGTSARTAPWSATARGKSSFPAGQNRFTPPAMTATVVRPPVLPARAAGASYPWRRR
jgi:hypothetical protein